MKRQPAAFSPLSDSHAIRQLCITSTAKFDTHYKTTLYYIKTCNTSVNHKKLLQCKPMKIADDIPKDLLAQFLNWEISSSHLARLTGYHAVAIRRAIKRPPKPKEPKNKKALFAARNAFRMSIAHLPPKEIQRLANVSASTADRIRRMYREQKNA